MRNIRITDAVIERMCEQVRTAMKGTVVTKDKLDLSVPLKLTLADVDKPTVMVSAMADQKMRNLVLNCNEEIAWHGTVSYDAESNTYLIEDIFVFPQYTTAATVQSIDEEYGPWLMTLDDETFSKLRMHGHSHVSMGVTPSGVDTTYQEQLIQRVQDFYIFMIINKREDYHICVYDVVNNIMYDKADIIVDMYMTEPEEWAINQISTQLKKRPGLTTTTAVPGLPAKLPVKKVWESGWVWDTKYSGFVPRTVEAYGLYLKEQAQAEAIQEAKTGSKGNKGKGNKGKGKEKELSSYEQYQQDLVQAMSKDKKFVEPSEVCDGICYLCKDRSKCNTGYSTYLME